MNMPHISAIPHSHTTVAPAVLRDGPAVLAAESVHRGQVLQWPILPHGVHELLQGLLELRRVEPVPVVGPPGVVKPLAAGAEVHPDMAHCAQRPVRLVI